MNNEIFIKKCYELAIQAGKKGYDTFGAILVHDGKIRGRKRQRIPKEEVWIKIINFQRCGNVCTLKCRIKNSNL